MALREMLQVGSSFNVPVKTFWCDSEDEIANLPKNVPAGSICECQVAPAVGSTKSKLKIFMFHKVGEDPNSGEWYEI